MSFSAQGQDAKKTRILFLLDASSSMTYKWNKDYNRFAIARDILLQIVDSIYSVNNEIEFGVRSYGTEYPAQQKNCTDSKLIVPFNLQNVNQIKQSLLFTTPIGWSPIAYSLKQSANNEINSTSEYDYSIIFITDGGESCGGDICKTFANLLKNKISITPYIIGLDNNNNLKSYYECLGKYVAVQDVDDVPKAVKLIVDENRPILTKKKKLNLKTVYSNTPIKKNTTVKPKVIKPKVVKTKKVVKRNYSEMQVLNPTSGVQYSFNPSQTPISLNPLYSKLEYRLDYNMEPPVKRIKQGMPRLSPKQITLSKSNPTNITPIQLYPIYDKLVYALDYQKQAPPVKKVTENLKLLRPIKPQHTVVYAYSVPRPIYIKPIYRQVVYSFNFTPPEKKIVKAKPKPKVVKTNPSDNSGKVNVSREVIPNDKTMVQVFFVNKFQKKKMYGNATPTIVMKDASTQKEVKRFIRTVSRGVPEMKSIKAGTYNFMVSGGNRLTTDAIRIDENSINKIFIEVLDGTIEFGYNGNLKRPMKEFQAIVNPRFEAKGKTVVQECTDKLYFAPATYYVEINTMPTTRFAMVELDFGEIKIITIDEPGFIQINNTNALGQVDFKHVLNDKYVRFHSIKVNGNIIDQKVQLQPGTYKVIYNKRPGVPQAGQKELLFKVLSNKTTQLILM